ncbi:hypothetical protein SAMN04488518_105207 [Pseudovibrio ascidiaceicola]|uniref:Uncharacterized protein n=1 Tax=Pseudovibrio ascidiaceicola TaxID=285279 RepID=A0A1I3ZRA1_9HYPH|nr:hypothetical protein SAMN04488518_105207 [Pseudovibrio ascidiaceicola]
MTCCENTRSAEDHKLAVLTLSFWRRQITAFRRTSARLFTIELCPWLATHNLALLELHVAGRL